MDKEYALFIGFMIVVSILYIYFSAIENVFGFGDETYYYLASKSVLNHKWDITYIDKLYATGNLTGQGEFLGKPPISYYIPAIFYWLGNGDITIYKLFTPLFGILTILLVFLIGKKFYSTRVGIIAAIFTASIPLFIHFSIITYLETLDTFMLLLVLYTSFIAMEKKDKKSIILAGVIFSLFVKEISFFIPIFFIIFLILMTFNRKFDKNDFKTLFIITLIGLALYSPWMLRNWLVHSNPVYPLYPSIFGYKDLDTESLILRQNSTNFISLFNLSTLISYFSPLIILLTCFGISLAFVKSSKENIWLVSFLIAFLLPIILVPYTVDIRYLFQEIPIIALLSALFVTEIFDFMKNKKYFSYAVLIIIAVISLYSITTVYSEAIRVDTLRSSPTGYAEAYSWINKNTSTDAVFMDLFTPNLVYFTGRVATFPHIVNSGELWNFWKLSEQDALKLLSKENINYIVVDSDLVYASQSSVWITFPVESINTMESWGSFTRVYDNGHIIIYKINYESKVV